MNDSLVLLTVRGAATPKTIDATRALHNDTAGSAQGIAAARALGDLSHKVYVPVTKAGGTEEGELLFLDVWLNAQGIGQFFSNPHVQEQGGKLFTKRDPVMWMPALGAFGFDLPAAQNKTDRFLGIVRGVVKSPEEAIESFRKGLTPKLADARRRGQLSHHTYIRMGMPSVAETKTRETLPPELIGIDVWCDAEGMQEHYRTFDDVHFAFAGKPAQSVWAEAQGFSEW